MLATTLLAFSFCGGRMSTIVFDATVFREWFPQFADATAFPTLTLQTDFDLATAYVSANTYGCLPIAARTQALYLMTAHLAALEVIISANGYTGQPGVVEAATVDKLQITLQPPPARGQLRWWLQLTPYGSRLVALLSIRSMGGFYVGGLPERAAFRKVGGIF